MPPKSDSSCNSIYRWIVDDVAVNLEEEFRGSAELSEAILGELKQRWEQKLIDQGLLGGQEPSAPAPDAQGLAYAQPLAGHTDVARAGISGFGGNAVGLAGAKRKEPETAAPKHEDVAAHQQQYQTQLQYISQLQQRQVAYAPQQQQQPQAQQQQQYAHHLPAQPQMPMQAPAAAQVRQYMQPPQQQQQQQQQQPPQLPQQPQQLAYAHPGMHVLPQHDGPADVGGGEDGYGAEDNAGAEAGGDDAADDAVLSEDGEDENKDEEMVENLLIGQFDKVNKMKQRWKVTMKDCVFHINGKDYLFKKCTGEFLLDL